MVTKLIQKKHLATYFQVGDRVVALPDHKAWAELVAVPATSVFALPAGMSYLDAAAITMNYTVAYILLFELANLAPGKSLLLHSAGGGVVSLFRCYDMKTTIIQSYKLSERGLTCMSVKRGMTLKKKRYEIMFWKIEDNRINCYAVEEDYAVVK